MWIHYIGGHGAGEKLIAVEIGLGESPEQYLADLRKASPFKLVLLKLEEGSIGRFETIQDRFKSIRLQGGSWYRATEALMDHIAALPDVDHKPKTRRISLLLPPDEFVQVEKAVEVLGTKTKNRLVRRALRSYLNLVRFRAQGYKIQAIKGGRLVLFDDDLDIQGPDDDRN